jgi:hypothetical protein
MEITACPLWQQADLYFDLYFASMADGQMDPTSLPLPSIRDFSRTWRRCWSLVLLSIAEIGSTNILVIVAERLQQH